MHFSPHILALFMATLVAALPSINGPVDSKVGYRQDTTPTTGTYNFVGDCLNQTVPLAYNSCTALMEPWAHNASSFTPAMGVVCWLNRSNNCSDLCRSPSGCNKIVEYPGHANLSDWASGRWENTIGSYTCEYDRCTASYPNNPCTS